MLQRILVAGVSIVVLLLLFDQRARADAPGGPPLASPPAATQGAPPPDKSQFTLFNPTPADQMRQMDTDRPNTTNSPQTIDAGHVQLEAGVFDYTFDRDESPGADTRSDTWDLGELNFRLGVLNNLELNAAIDAYGNTRVRDYRSGANVRADGFNDTVVGGKLNVWGNEAINDDTPWKNALAIQPQFELPTASRGLSTGHFQFIVLVPFLINLPDHFHLSVQPGASYDRNSRDNGYVAGFNGAIALDRVLIGNLDAYVEYAAYPTTEKHVETPQTLDVGAVYPLNANVQLDTGVFVGLNRASNTVEWTAGISVRF